MNIDVNNAIKIILFVLLLLCLFFWKVTIGSAEHSTAESYPEVDLAHYGSLEPDSIQKTFQRAVSDLNGKKLVVPARKIFFGKLDITGKNHFEIEFLPGGEVNCEQFRLIDCQYFAFHGMNLKGTREKFAVFDIIGNSYGFSIYDCKFDSEKDKNGQNTFYGIHVRANWNMADRKYENSPRAFKIYNNHIRNTKYDGILVHAHCSDFVIENNVVEDAKCIGIEVEGRYGGWKNTTVHPCKNAIIRNNTLNRCGDWGILLMWVDSVKVYDNVSKKAVGAFLSVGCSNVEVKRNVFEGSRKGFEISQEFYKIDNGINRNVVVEDNVIVGIPREINRGAIDIRHAQNITVKNNKVECLFKPNAACISVASSRDVVVSDNTFAAKSGMPYRTMLDEAADPETGKETESLSIENIDLRRNAYSGIKDDHAIKVSQIQNKNCYVK